MLDNITPLSLIFMHEQIGCCIKLYWVKKKGGKCLPSGTTMGLATPSCAAIDAGCSRLWFFSISCVLNTSVKTRLSVSALAGLPTRIKFCTSIVWRHIVPPVFVSINQMRPKAQTILNAFLRQISFAFEMNKCFLWVEKKGFSSPTSVLLNKMNVRKLYPNFQKKQPLGSIL